MPYNNNQDKIFAIKIYMFVVFLVFLLGFVFGNKLLRQFHIEETTIGNKDPTICV